MNDTIVYSSAKPNPSFKRKIYHSRAHYAKKCGCVHITHNAQECCTYEKESTLKKKFAGREACGPLQGLETCYHKSGAYAQLSSKNGKNEKSNRKLKCAQKRHKCHDKSYCNDSDSSLSIGRGGFGEHMTKCKKNQSVGQKNLLTPV